MAKLSAKIIPLKKIKTFGNSMYPLLQDSDTVYLKRIKFLRIKVNDIITLRKFRKFLTHRVIYKQDNYVITKGDNNLTSDGKIYPKQIIGKLYRVKRGNIIFKPEDLYLIQSSLYFAEIIKIKNAFEKEKIDFVFLKGLPLHLYFDKSHPRRIYADCDILIIPKDYLKAKKVLEKYNYKYHDDSYSKTHKILKDKQTEFSFYKKINNFPVLFDIHLEAVFMMNQLGELNELYPQKFIDQLTNEFLKTKQTITIQNQKFLILNSEFLILYLSLHFFHHNFCGAYRLEFLKKVIGHYSPGRSNFVTPSRWPNGLLEGELWQKLSKEILDYRLQNFVYPVFLLLKKYYNIPNPHNFLEQIKPQKDQLAYIENNIVTINIFDDEPRIKAGITRFRTLFFLSPNPLWRKLMIVFNLQVMYSIFWVFWRKLS